VLLLGGVLFFMATARGAAASPSVLSRLGATPTFSPSTVPANGDVNPYGVAFVPRGFPSGGPLQAGDILVSNFNDSANLQGTGTTIVRVDRMGTPSLFFQGPTGLGLTTALGVLRGGYVLVGNVPSPTGTCTSGANGAENGVGQGSLLIIDRHGNLVTTLQNSAFLDGPWFLTIRDEGERAQVYVANALNGTVSRLDLRIERDVLEVHGMTRVASGYVHRCDPAALVVGPTGLALDGDGDDLYVASTGDNAVYLLDHIGFRGDQGPGRIFIQDQAHLHGPLALARTPGGHFLSAQGDAVNADPAQPSEIVEFDDRGRFVDERSVDSAPGSAFGLAFMRQRDGFVFAAVDDGQNVLDVWNVR
jgi:DNA-binding beta-propeller fold protein YncE